MKTIYNGYGMEIAAHSRCINIQRAKVCLVGNATNVHFRRWAISLKQRGCNIVVVSYRNADLTDVKIYDISCVEMRGNAKCEEYVRILRGIKMLLLLRRALRDIKPDLVHVHYLFNTPLAFGFWGIKRLIVSPWGNDIIYDYDREPLLKILYKKTLLRRATEITTLSEFLSKQIRRYLKCKPQLIPFGVDTSIFNGSRKRVDNTVTISFVKHLEEKYGPKYLIEAVPLILNEHKSIKVNIVGSGSQREMLDNLVKEFGIQSYIDFIEKISHEKVVDILRNTDIFVMPSVYKSESFGVAAIEASAMKIPVVASNFGGIREAVIDGKTGILVPPCDAEAIARACIKLIKNKSLRERLGENGRNYVKKKFEWQSCVDKMIEVYSRVLEQ